MMLRQVSQQWVTCDTYLAKELTVNSSPDLAGSTNWPVCFPASIYTYESCHSVSDLLCCFLSSGSGVRESLGALQCESLSFHPQNFNINTSKMTLTMLTWQSPINLYSLA